MEVRRTSFAAYRTSVNPSSSSHKEDNAYVERKEREANHGSSRQKKQQNQQADSGENHTFVIYA